VRAHVAGRADPPKYVTLKFLLGDSESISFFGSVPVTRLLAVRLLLGGERLEYDYFPVDATALRTSSSVNDYIEQLIKMNDGNNGAVGASGTGPSIGYIFVFLFLFTGFLV
jgi:hypothetical protein